MPKFIRPCAPILRREPPAGPEWAHEVKWDGWRLQAHKAASGVVLYSRPGNDLSDRFPAIAEAVAGLPRRSVILDGELVAFGEDGRPDFHLLRRKRAAVVAFLFDILERKRGDGRHSDPRRSFAQARAARRLCGCARAV